MNEIVDFRIKKETTESMREQRFVPVPGVNVLTDNVSVEEEKRFAERCKRLNRTDRNH